jgi:hypothetical protein
MKNSVFVSPKESPAKGLDAWLLIVENNPLREKRSSPTNGFPVGETPMKYGYIAVALTRRKRASCWG